MHPSSSVRSAAAPRALGLARAAAALAAGVVAGIALARRGAALGQVAAVLAIAVAWLTGAAKQATH